MKMQDVQEIKEVRSVDEANKLLDKGWEILRITQTATGLMFNFGKKKELSSKNILIISKVLLKLIDKILKNRNEVIPVDDSKRSNNPPNHL